ncbi:LysR family transcriptional regulator [Flindersiella endophytica]
MTTVELRDLHIFLTLADELHFARAADRLGLTPSRVSQVLRDLERRLGGQLVYRTSRRVELTSFGERFRAEAGTALAQLTDVIERAQQVNRNRKSTVRIGVYSEPAGRGLVAAVKAFTAQYPECAVQVTENPINDTFGPLHRGEVDLVASWLPHGRTDLVTGPILAAESHVLAVARDHPLAQRPEVSADDLPDQCAFMCRWLPSEFRPRWHPSRTGTNTAAEQDEFNAYPKDDLRGILTELAYLIATGTIVHPTIRNAFAHPDIAYVPIMGLPPLRNALLWRRGGNLDPTVSDFIRVTRNLTLDSSSKRCSSPRVSVPT